MVGRELLKDLARQMRGGIEREPQGPLPLIALRRGRLRDAARDRPARDLARPLDRAGRDRRATHADGSGLGRARVAVPARRAQALPPAAAGARRAAAARRGRHLARSLRPPRHAHGPRARRAAARRSSRPSASARISSAGASRPSASPSSTGDESHDCRAACDSPRRPRAISRAAASRTATRPCGRRGSSQGRAAPRVLQRRHRLYDRATARSASSTGPSIWSLLEDRRVPSDAGATSTSARRMRCGRTRAAAAAVLPVHWGTFNLAFHAWDEPVERLVAPRASGTCGRSCPCWASRWSRRAHPSCAHGGGTSGPPR